MFNIEVNEKQKPCVPCLILPRGSARLDHLSSLLAIVKKEV